MKGFELSQKLYLRTISLRDGVFMPLVKFFSFLNLNPNAITLLGVVSMLPFIFFIKINSTVSLLFLLSATLCDLLDGALARFQKRQSDRGKFIDVVGDITVLVLFIGGLIYANLISGVVGLALVFTLVFSKIFRIIYNARFFRSDWQFRAVAGFIPNFITGISYLFFLIYALSTKNYLPVTLVISSSLLFVDMIFYFNRIISH